MALPLSDLAYDIPVLGPIAVAVTGIGTTSTLAIAADNLRRGIIFHNPSLTVPLRIVPSNLTPVAGSGGIIIYPGQEQEFWAEGDAPRLQINTAWNVVADSGSNNGLTILNFTDFNPAQPNPPEPIATLNQDIPITSPTGTQISNLGTASQQVFSANPTRRAVSFINPGTIDAWVCPANLAANNGAGSLRILAGGQKTIRARGRIRVNCAWNARSDSGSNNSLTLLRFF